MLDNSYNYKNRWNWCECCFWNPKLKIPIKRLELSWVRVLVESASRSFFLGYTESEGLLLLNQDSLNAVFWSHTRIKAYEFDQNKRFLYFIVTKRRQMVETIKLPLKLKTNIVNLFSSRSSVLPISHQIWHDWNRSEQTKIWKIGVCSTLRI